MNRSKAYSMLGLCMRAGGLSSGETAAEAQIRSGRAKLVILALDASHNTKKKFTNLCHTNDVPLLVYGSREQLGSAIGKELRSIIAVADASFAKEIRKQVEEEEGNNEERSVL